MRRDSDPNAVMTILAGISGAMILVVVVALLQASFYRSESAERKGSPDSPQQLADVRSRQLEVLNNYRWIDRRDGVVGIPIDRAIGVLLSEANRRPSNAPNG